MRRAHPGRTPQAPYLERADPDGVEAVHGVAASELALRPLRVVEVAPLGLQPPRNPSDVPVFDHPLAHLGRVGSARGPSQKKTKNKKTRGVVCFRILH